MPLPNIQERLGPQLWIACEQHDFAQVKALTSSTARTWKDWSNLLCAAANHESIEIANYSVEKGALITDEVLINVALGVHGEPVYRHLIDTGIIPVDADIERWGNILGIFASNGKYSLVQFLLEKGGNPNYTVSSHGGKSSLACAAVKGNKEMMTLLLDHGAELADGTALMYAAESGQKESVKLLLARGADVNVNPDNSSKHFPSTHGPALQKAVENGHEEIMDTLLQAGADVTLKDANGQTASDIATQKGMDQSILERLKASP